MPKPALISPIEATQDLRPAALVVPHPGPVLEVGDAGRIEGPGRIGVPRLTLPVPTASLPKSALTCQS